MNTMVTVTMPRSNWRAVHGALLELCLMWGSGVKLRHAGGRDFSPETDEPASEILGRVIPFLSVATAWPEVSDLESQVRALFGLDIPEDMLEYARGHVRELDARV